MTFEQYDRGLVNITMTYSVKLKTVNFIFITADNRKVVPVSSAFIFRWITFAKEIVIFITQPSSDD